MSLLFAHLEHQIRRTAVSVGRAIVEKCTGFASYEAGDFLAAAGDDDDSLSRAHAILKFSESVHSLVGICECFHWMHAGNVCAVCGCTDARLRSTSAAGSPNCECWPVEYEFNPDCPMHGKPSWFTPTVSAGGSAGLPTTAPPAGLTPICEVLDKHFPQGLSGGRYDCNPGTEMCPIWPDEQAWREHVAPLIAERIAQQ